MEFVQSTGALNHFNSAYEQWQIGLAEAVINSIMRLARTVMAESGLGGDSGSRQPSQAKMHAMLHTSSCSGRPLILAIWRAQRFFTLPRFRMQGMRLPQCGKEGEG